MSKIVKQILIEAIERQRNKEYTVEEVVGMLQEADFETLRKATEEVYTSLNSNGVFILGELKAVETFNRIVDTFKNNQHAGFDLMYMIRGMATKDSKVNKNDKYIVYESAMDFECLQSIKDLDALKEYLNLEDIADYIVEEKLVDKLFY